MAGISQQRLEEMEAEMDRFESEILSEPSASDLPRVVIGSNTYNQVSSQLKMFRAQSNMSESERIQRQQEVTSQLKVLRAASESRQQKRASSDEEDEEEAYNMVDRDEPPVKKPALDPSLTFLPPPPPPPMLTSTPTPTPSFVPPQLQRRAPPPPPPNRPQGPPGRPQGPGPGGPGPHGGLPGPHGGPQGPHGGPPGPHSGPPGPPRMRPPPPPHHARPTYPGPHMGHGPGPGPMQGPGPHSGPHGPPGHQSGPGGFPGHQQGHGGFPHGPHPGMGGMGGPGGPGPGGPMRMPGPPMGGPGGPGPRPGFMQGPRPMGGPPQGPPGDNMYSVSSGEAHSQVPKVVEKVEEDKPKVIYASAPMITVQRTKKGKKKKKKNLDGEEGQGDGATGDNKGEPKSEPSGPKLPNSLKSYTITMPQPVDNMLVADMELDIGANQPKEKKKKKEKKFVRMAAGTTWEDQSLSEWDPDDFRLFCGDLGNEVSDENLGRAFSKYPSFVRAKVVRDKRSNKTKGYGFVSFKDPTDYVRAMREMNGKYVGNRPIKLRKSNWKDRNIEVVKKKEREKKKLGLK